MKLSYKYNNDESKIDLIKKEFDEPSKISFFLKDGDSLFVEDGQYVKTNQLVIKNNTGIKYFSSISGNVIIKGNSIIISKSGNNDDVGEEKDSLMNLDDVTKDEILNVCIKFGIGYNNKSLKELLLDNRKILVLNAIDSDPYQFTNKFLLENNIKNTLDTINIIGIRFDMKIFLLMSKYDTKNLFAVKSLLASYPNINLIVVNSKFPYNDETILLKKYFKEYKKEEILNLDIVTLNKAFVGLKSDTMVNERYITIVLNNPLRYFVVNAKYGSFVQEIIDQLSSISWGGKVVYLNNYLRKVECTNLDLLTVTDNIKTVFVFDSIDDKVTKCIRCGKCTDVCPIKINPLDEKLDSTCIKCGLCNYICPANINLLVRVKKHDK